MIAKISATRNGRGMGSFSGPTDRAAGVPRRSLLPSLSVAAPALQQLQLGQQSFRSHPGTALLDLGQPFFARGLPVHRHARALIPRGDAGRPQIAKSPERCMHTWPDCMVGQVQVDGVITCSPLDLV